METPATLLLTYSAFLIHPDLRVGEIVATALRDAGLRVAWDGNPTERLHVRITDWRKPLPV